MGRIQSSIGLITGIDIESTVTSLMELAAQPVNLLEKRTAELEERQVAITTPLRPAGGGSVHYRQSRQDRPVRDAVGYQQQFRRPLSDGHRRAGQGHLPVHGDPHLAAASVAQQRRAEQDGRPVRRLADVPVRRRHRPHAEPRPVWRRRRDNPRQDPRHRPLRRQLGNRSDHRPGYGTTSWRQSTKTARST